MVTHKKTGFKHPKRLRLFWVASAIFIAYALLADIAFEIFLSANGALSSIYTTSAKMALPIGLFFLLLSLWQSIYAIIEILERSSGTRIGINENMRSLLSGQTLNRSLLIQLRENSLLSESVKAVAFRQKDQEVIVEAIHQDMQSEQWPSALRLINTLEERFGCKEDAAKLRGDLQQYKNATLNEKIERAYTRIKELWYHHRYDDAQKLENNLVAMYPNTVAVQNLTGNTLVKRLAYKEALLVRWDDAIKNNKVDEGIELLTLLDKFITPTEAAAMQEAARGVFKAQLHNLGVKFSLSVTQRDWHKALSVGKDIVDEFPNSCMAQEVREKLDILEQRARGVD